MTGKDNSRKGDGVKRSESGDCLQNLRNLGGALLIAAAMAVVFWLFGSYAPPENTVVVEEKPILQGIEERLPEALHSLGQVCVVTGLILVIYGALRASRGVFLWKVFAAIGGLQLAGALLLT